MTTEHKPTSERAVSKRLHNSGAGRCVNTEQLLRQRVVTGSEPEDVSPRPRPRPKPERPKPERP